jgi:hypothetical protein
MGAIERSAELTLPARVGARSRAHVALTVAVVGGTLALMIGGRLVASLGNLTGFVEFGLHFAPLVHPPSGALIGSPFGYDGQFFYLQGLDPLLLHNSTVAAMRAASAGFRMQRLGYPALAFLLAGGQPDAMPFALLALNVLVLLGLTAALACYLERRGRSGLWAVPVALMPGMLLPVLRDLSDPLATASLLAGVLCWRDRRRGAAALALTVAVLTREVMIVALPALALDAWLRGPPGGGIPTAARRLVANAWPALALPALAFVAWQAYVSSRYGGLLGTAGAGPPLINLINEVRGSAHTGSVPYAAWDTTYVLLIVLGVLAALRGARLQPTALNLCACALSVGVLLPTLGDLWADTRLSAPVFVLLLLDGLERRDRRSLWVACAAAAMSVLVPFVAPGI